MRLVIPAFVAVLLHPLGLETRRACFFFSAPKLENSPVVWGCPELLPGMATLQRPVAGKEGGGGGVCMHACEISNLSVLSFLFPVVRAAAAIAASGRRPKGGAAPPTPFRRHGEGGKGNTLIHGGGLYYGDIATAASNDRDPDSATGFAPVVKDKRLRDIVAEGIGQCTVLGHAQKSMYASRARIATCAYVNAFVHV